MARDSTSSNSQGNSISSSVHDDEQIATSHGLDLHSQLPRVMYDDDELYSSLDGTEKLSGKTFSGLREDIASFDTDADPINFDDSFYEDDDPDCTAPRIHNPLYNDPMLPHAKHGHKRAAGGSGIASAQSHAASAGGSGIASGQSHVASAGGSGTASAQSHEASAGGMAGANVAATANAVDGEGLGAKLGSSKLANDEADADAERAANGSSNASRDSGAIATTLGINSFSADTTHIGDKSGTASTISGSDGVVVSKDDYDASDEAAVREYINRQSSLEKLRESHSQKSADRNLKLRMLKSDSAKDSLHTPTNLKNAKLGRSVMFHAALLLVPLVLIWTVIGTFTYHNVSNLKYQTTELRENIVPSYETSNRLVQDILRISFLVDMTAQSMDMSSAYNNYNNLIFLLKNSPVYGIPELAEDVAVLRGKIDNLYKAKAHLHQDTRDIFNTWLVCYGSIENFLLLTDEHDMYREMLGHDHSSLMQGYSSFSREITVHLKNVGRFIGPQCSEIYQRRNYVPQVDSTRDWLNQDRHNQKYALDSNLKHVGALSKEETKNIMAPAELKSTDVGTNRSAQSSSAKAGAKANAAERGHADESAMSHTKGSTPALATDGVIGGAVTTVVNTANSAQMESGTAATAAVADASAATAAVDNASAPTEAVADASAATAAVANPSEPTEAVANASAPTAAVGNAAADAAAVACADAVANAPAAQDVADAGGFIGADAKGEPIRRINTGSGVMATADVAGESVSTATEGVLAVGNHTNTDQRNETIRTEASNIANAATKANSKEESGSPLTLDELDKHGDEVAEALLGKPTTDLGNIVATGSAVAAGIDARVPGIPEAQLNAIGLIKSSGESQIIAARSQLKLHQMIESRKVSKEEKIFYACRAFDTQYAALEVMHEHQQESLRQFNYAYSDLMSLVISMRFKVDALVKVRPATASAEVERAAYTLHHNAVVVLLCAAASIFFACVYAVYFFASPITELHRQIRDFVRSGKLPNNETTQISESREIISDLMPILEDYSLLQTCSGELVSYSKALSDPEYIDGLTSVHNRLALDKLCADGRELQPMSAVLLVDIDRFASFNANNGQVVGDALLKEITHILQRNIFSAKDLLFRYNADSFCIIMQQCTVEEMLIFIADISKEIKKLRYKHISKHIKGFDTQPLINTDFYLSAPEPDALSHDTEDDERQRISMLDAEVASMTDLDVVDSSAGLNHLDGANGDRQAMWNKRLQQHQNKHEAEQESDSAHKYNNTDMSMLGNDAFYATAQTHSDEDTATKVNRSNNFDAAYAESVAAEAAQAMASASTSLRGEELGTNELDKDSSVLENFVAVSIGVSYADDRMINTSMKLAEHISMAVQALLSAKCKGGNNTVIYDDTGMGQRRAKLARAAAELEKADEEAKAIKDAEELASNKQGSNQDLDVIVEYGEDSISVKPASSQQDKTDGDAS